MKLRVVTHSGDEDIVEVTSYDSQQLADKINDNSILSIALGNNVYSRIDIKNVKPEEENI